MTSGEVLDISRTWPDLAAVRNRGASVSSLFAFFCDSLPIRCGVAGITACGLISERHGAAKRSVTVYQGN
jgi:hypothetical protein